MARQNQVKLKDPSGMFVDHETGFRVKLREEKPLEEPIGRLTREWMNAGGLVLVKHVEKTVSADEMPEESSQMEPLGDATPLDGEEDVSTPSPSLPPLPDEEVLRSMKAADLRKLCKSRGIQTKRWDTVNVLVKKLLGI